MENPKTTIRIDNSQLDRAKNLQKEYNKKIKDILNMD
ncbi:hypothetical protein MBCUT_08830 [Methanobrevibacter cuticularis]|uniref:Uncharacterized protein n=1 Tax=Methanobrevibacter cuticularis TaxID=47311 RepID=A0A166E6H8_9EURY|nr:hypothetical protein MBCUT_08830 [Methanobrevibacter cuticularis]